MVLKHKKRRIERFTYYGTFCSIESRFVTTGKTGVKYVIGANMLILKIT
ncbi:hypothetical protein [Bacillus paramycoides]